MSTGFAGQVAAWRRSVEMTATTVLRDAVRGIVEEAGAHAGPGEVADDIRRQLKAINPGSIRLGGIFLVQAEHDRGQALNYGFTITDEWRRTHSQPGRNFIGLTARRWPRIVRETAQRFKT
jgi:hypothetical protein